MKENLFKIIRWLCCLGIGITVALVGCGPASMPLSDTTATPTARSSGLPVRIFTLCADGEWLWIATVQGMIRLNQNSLDYELFSRTGTSPDVELSYLYTLKVDDQGRLWAGGKPGLLRYTDEAGWKVIYTGEGVVNFGLDAEGNLWYWKSIDPRWQTLQAYRFHGQEPPVVGDWEPEYDGLHGSYPHHSGWRFLALQGESVQNESIKDANGNTWSWSYMRSWLMIYCNDQRVHRLSLGLSDPIVAVAAAEQTGIWIALDYILLYSDGKNLKRYKFTID